MSISLKEIANQLGVSKTTVSWVLNGDAEARGISQATQDKVLALARELSYTPNLIARGLSTGNMNTIGLIVPDITDSFYSEIVVCMEKNAEERGYNIMIGNSESKIERENELIRTFRSHQVDGIILAPTKISHTQIDRLAKDHVPFVLFDRYFPELQTNYVIVDNFTSSYCLVKNLLTRGCRKIALITTNDHLKTMNMRREGYEKALAEVGIPLNPDLVGNSFRRLSSGDADGHQPNTRASARCRCLLLHHPHLMSGRFLLFL